MDQVSFAMEDAFVSISQIPADLAHPQARRRRCNPVSVIRNRFAQNISSLERDESASASTIERDDRPRTLGVRVLLSAP